MGVDGRTVGDPRIAAADHPRDGRDADLVGAALVLLGLVQIGVLADSPFRAVERATKHLSKKQAVLRRQHPVAGFTAFGFFYLAAGFG